MAPQIKEKNDGSEEGSQATVAMNLPSWKSLPTFAERDKAVRSQEDRRRGWSDYRVLFVGTDASKGQLSEEEIIRALSGNTERCQTQGRSGHDTWNLFGVGGEEKIVSLLTPPVMYGRFPNYRARDLVIQSADAIILVTTPHIHVHKNAVATFEMVRKSLEGAFQNSFRYGTQVSNASLEKVKELDASQPRPVYILLSESRAKYDLECQKLKEERQRMKLTERPTPTFEEAVQKVRNECETFMKDFGEAHGVKLITLPDDCEAADLRPFVLQACEDASNNVGVRFQVKKVSEAPLNIVRKLTPIESKATPGERVRAVNYVPPHKRGIAAYPTLDKIVSVVGEDTKKNDNKNNNNWNLFTPQLLSFDSTD